MQEKTLESPLDCKETQPVNPKGNQSGIFTERSDAEGEAPILWPPDSKSWLTGKDLMLGKIGDRRRRVWQRIRWLDGITNSMFMNPSKLLEMVKDREVWHTVVHGVSKSWTKLSHLTQQFPEGYFCQKNKLISSFMWKGKGAKLDKIILKKKTKGRRILH